MSMQHGEQSGPDDDHVVVIGPDGQQVSVPAAAVRPVAPVDGDDEEGARPLTDLVEQPAKVMRIGRMVQQLLEEVKSAPVDEPGRKRLADVVHTSITELKDGLAPELDEELDRLIKPFEDGTPTESEIRIAQAQLVGWLEGLSLGIETAIYPQQLAARGQLVQMLRALPPGAVPGQHPQQQGAEEADQQGNRGGMYL